MVCRFSSQGLDFLRDFRIHGVRLEFDNLGPWTAKFDMTLRALDYNNNIVGSKTFENQSAFYHGNNINGIEYQLMFNTPVNWSNGMSIRIDVEITTR